VNIQLNIVTFPPEKFT